MKIKLILLINVLLLLVALITLPGCNAIENLTNSSTKLILESITGPDIEGTEGSTIAFSDVVREGGIFNDNGEVSLNAQLLSPGTTNSTYYQDILIDQVDVSYSRTDGLNVEGKDVPYRFSQKVHARILVGQTTTFGFMLVQHNAKIESPLLELRQLGQEHVLKLEAQITFHGKDLAGNRVEPVTGSISVWCADFADPA